jgi:hypothetical protein
MLKNFHEYLMTSLKRYQRGNQHPYIEEEQTTPWPKEKIQKDKQRSTKHTYKTKDRVTRTPLKTGGELRCSGRVSSSCSTSGTRHVNLVTTLCKIRSINDHFRWVKVSGTAPYWNTCILTITRKDSKGLPVNLNLNTFHWPIYTIGLNTSFTTYIKFSPVSYKHRSDR